MKSVFKHAQLSYDEQFVNETFPEHLENRNYKWINDTQKSVNDGFAAHRIILNEELAYLKEMESLLHSLGYEK